MTQLGQHIDTRVVFYVEYSRKGADDWFRNSGPGYDSDSVERAIVIRDNLNTTTQGDGFEYRVVRETTTTEVVKL